LINKCDNVVNNVNSKNNRSRMEAGSVGKVRTGAKEDVSSTGRVRAAGFHRVTAHSHLAGILKLMNSLSL
jgi:hypothetical protein